MKFPLTKWLAFKGEVCPKREELLNTKRNILFSRFSLMALVVCGVHTILDGAQGLRTSSLFDAIIGSVILVAYLLARFGWHTAGKVLLLAFLNLALVVYCSIVSKYNGVFLFFFPLIGLSYVVFDYAHRLAGLAFVGLSMACLVALVCTDFKLLGDVSIGSSNQQTSFLINILSSSLILVVCINFMMKYNDESEISLIHLADEVGQKNEHLEKTNSELDRFVYSASHDLRAPLLSIQGIVNIARYENTNPEVESYLTMIGSQITKLDCFIKDIINYSQNSRTDVAEEPVDFDSMVAGLRENLRFMNGVDRIRWVTEIDNNLELKTDRSRIGTVLNNLISNAIKFHNYSLDDQWIKIGVKRDCKGCQIIVKDNGVGIPPEHQKRVFDMFYRAHDKSNGSGLGLYIVKEIVAKLNGTIQLQSQPGQGSTFMITLPNPAV